MIDIPPLAACPFGKDGRHDISAIVPGEDEGDITLYCGSCGTIRRFAASGRLVSESIDDLSAEEINNIVRRAR